ncbi:hypothetical protein BDN72DRAFT_905525 [Pluteus cervinus]|uniref:Uncharacterized protein n=1 Tax=Pluteus cervinus TaxID=181527 RepID=A0ACD3A2C5_9AGAR|nr:hypothetical protein BDN72DRAFT_905525 [Pluteus cervinus]
MSRPAIQLLVSAINARRLRPQTDTSPSPTLQQDAKNQAQPPTSQHLNNSTTFDSRSKKRHKLTMAPLPSDLHPDMLATNLQLLAHTPPEEPLTIYDGLVGAVISNGDSFVTSPNARIIPYPPLGGNRDVYIRENLRYGDDDPLQWPQPVIPGYKYLCAIPLPPLDPTADTAIMWWMPQKDDFDQGGVGLSGVGRFRQYSLQRLRDVSSSLLERSQADGLSFDYHAQRATDYRDVIRHNLYRLECYKSSFTTMQRSVRHLQRAYLELTALVEWHTTIKFRIAELEPSQAARSCARTIGGFTPSPVVADYLFRAGIRVWLIRPYSELPNVHIRKVCAFILPENLIVVKAPFHRLTAIYTGSNFDPEKYIQIMRVAVLSVPRIRLVIEDEIVNSQLIQIAP